MLKQLWYTVIVSAAITMVSFVHAQPSGEDTFKCPEHPVAQWRSMESMAQKWRQSNYSIQSQRVTSGGCYELVATTASGEKLRLQVDPVSLRALHSDKLP